MKKITLVLILLICTLYIKADSTPQWITAFENQNATNSWICFQKEINIKVVPATTSAKAATTRIQNSQQNNRNNFFPNLPMYSSMM